MKLGCKTSVRIYRTASATEPIDDKADPIKHDALEPMCKISMQTKEELRADELARRRRSKDQDKLKVKGPDIYIGLPPLTGKPEQQQFTMQSGVLTSS